MFAPGNGCVGRTEAYFDATVKGPGGVMGIGCIPAVYARRASGQIRSRNCFHFCVMTLFIGALKELFPAVRQLGSEVSWFRLVLRRRTPTIVAARVPPQSTDR